MSHFFTIHPFFLILSLGSFWWPFHHTPDKPPEDNRPSYTQLLDQEQQRRREAEANVLTQSQSRERWQQAAALLGILSVAVLLVGISLGSYARHESTH